MANFDILKLSIRGTLPGGEAWSVNPIFDAFNAYDGVEANDMNAVALAVRAVSVPDSLKNLMSSGAAITSFRLEGRTGGNELVLAAEAAPASGSITGLGVATKPYQTSVVASLLTGLREPRGAVGCTGRRSARVSTQSAPELAQRAYHGR